ncbi:type II toxin-antitoxin system VapC family toxin [Thermodesulfobacteriota bacterium]
MGIILDTSIIIEAERDRFDIEKFVKGREEEIFGLSVISVAELLHGVHRANTHQRRLVRSAFVERVIEIFMVYPFDIAPTRIYADIWANLQKKGILIGAHDLMIGSTALALGFSVASLNTRHFDRIEGLKLEIPNLYP